MHKNNYQDDQRGKKKEQIRTGEGLLAFKPTLKKIGKECYYWLYGERKGRLLKEKKTAMTGKKWLLLLKI